MSEIKRGTLFRHGDALAKVLVVSDGYVMARHKYAMPFVISVKEILPRIHLTPSPKTKEGKD